MSESRSDAASEPTGSTSPPLPPGRYGTTGTTGSTLSGKLVAVVLILLVGALLVAGAVTVYRLASTPDITGTAIGVTVVDDQRTLGGTGLGLAIALEDAALHDGWLQVWSQPDHGSCFVLTLPRVPGTEIQSSPIGLPPIDSADDAVEET